MGGPQALIPRHRACLRRGGHALRHARREARVCRTAPGIRATGATGRMSDMGIAFLVRACGRPRHANQSAQGDDRRIGNAFPGRMRDGGLPRTDRIHDRARKQPQPLGGQDRARLDSHSPSLVGKGAGQHLANDRRHRGRVRLPPRRTHTAYSWLWVSRRAPLRRPGLRHLAGCRHVAQRIQLRALGFRLRQLG